MDEFTTTLMEAITVAKDDIYSYMMCKGFDPIGISICITASILSDDLHTVLLKITLDDMEREID